ncbi:MAG: penicillin-binding transpeptidase domain-containing protein [Clostridia bacterium]|nr:penicillin-binding transpeptidase domain-containing protein [Clostridia bacterium]
MSGINLTTKKRLLFMLFFLTALVIVLAARITWIQMINGAWYQQKVFLRQSAGTEISAKRGTIFDRNGKELAVSTVVQSILADPAEVKKSKKDVDFIAEGLAQILSLDKQELVKKLNNKSRYEKVKMKVDKDLVDKVLEWTKKEKIKGIYVVDDTKRVYPNGSLASHVIGFTNVDNQGIDGIEASMEHYLKGVPGKVIGETDAAGRELPFDEEGFIAPQDGLNVVLTIDETIQHIAETAAEKAIKENNVKYGATILVMDPRNGDVLAMVSKPDFDLNNPWAAPPGVDAAKWKGDTKEDVKVLFDTVWKNKAIKESYEPGSTFKAITSAAGLEEGVVEPNSPVNDFTVKVAGWPIDCHKPNFHGNQTFAEGVYHSCNPVFVRVAQSLKIDRFYQYVKSFGFYDKTNIDLPEEGKSNFHPKPTEIDMATASFGQQFIVTPIQLITSYAAIANGGKLYKPRIVKELKDNQGNIVKRIEPEVVRNVISKKTSDTLKDILEGVVSSETGTGKAAYVKGYRVAGKTGTSEIKKVNKYHASFSAFAPVENPTICVLAVFYFMDKEQDHGGGAIAAPVVGKIIEDVLSYQGVERVYTEKDKEMMRFDVLTPDVRNKTVQEAAKVLKDSSIGLTYKVEGENDQNAVVVDQMPKFGMSVPQKSVVILYTKKQQPSMVTVPDLKNKTISEATQALSRVDLNIKASGVGNVVKQNVAPGEKVPKGQVIDVEFKVKDDEGQGTE